MPRRHTHPTYEPKTFTNLLRELQTQRDRRKPEKRGDRR